MTRLEDLRLYAAVGGVLRDAHTMGVNTCWLVTNTFDLESKVIANRNALAVNSKFASLAIASGQPNSWRSPVSFRPTANWDCAEAHTSA